MTNINKESMPSWSWRVKAQKSDHNWILEGRGLHLGGIWGARRRVLSALGSLIAVFWLIKNHVFQSIGPRWAQRAPLDRFSPIFEKFWEGFGKVWGGMLGLFGCNLRILCVPCCVILCYRNPALPRFAPRSVTILSYEISNNSKRVAKSWCNVGTELTPQRRQGGAVSNSARTSKHQKFEEACNPEQTTSTLMH